MIACIDSTAEKLSTLCVSPCKNEVLTTHHVPLEASSDQSVDVFANRHKHLASKMTALLTTVKLILEMNGSSTVLCEKLG